MIRLHLLLRDHADAVEADLQRFYGLDIADYYGAPTPNSFQDNQTKTLLVP